MSHERREITMRFLAQPTDVNFGGKVHGGTMMKWIDEVAYACASKWSGHYCVTAHIGDVSFYNPVMIGSLVELQAKVIYTGNTSMHIGVKVSSSSLRVSNESHAVRCLLIFVAVDDHGVPVSVEPWKPVLEEDVALEKFAKDLMKLRKELHQNLGKFEL